MGKVGLFNVIAHAPGHFGGHKAQFFTYLRAFCHGHYACLFLPSLALLWTFLPTFPSFYGLCLRSVPICWPPFLRLSLPFFGAFLGVQAHHCQLVVQHCYNLQHLLLVEFEALLVWWVVLMAVQSNMAFAQQGLIPLGGFVQRVLVLCAVSAVLVV